jgi:hypothetical protein
VISKQKNRIGPCREADEKWVRAWCSTKPNSLAYEWVKQLRKHKHTWHQIRSRINGKGY